MCRIETGTGGNTSSGSSFTDEATALRRNAHMERRLKASKQAAANDMSEVISLAQKGDGNAFKRLYMVHGQRIYGLFLRMAGDPIEAEDLTCQVFLRLFREIHTHRGEFSLSTRLHRLTLNVLLKELREKCPGHSSEVKLSGGHDPALVIG